jgi:hypothetical protein
MYIHVSPSPKYLLVTLAAVILKNANPDDDDFYLRLQHGKGFHNLVYGKGFHNLVYGKGFHDLVYVFYVEYINSDKRHK